MMKARKRRGPWLRLAMGTALAGVLCPCLSTAAPPQPPGQSFPAPPRAPQGAPNVLIIMTDDVGFGASDAFGGPIPTPTLDQLAATGVRFNEFHTTSLCAPSRAALLTGRNPHAVGFGSVPEMATTSPGYDSVIPKSAATIGRVLQLNGYGTAWFGKNHNTPTWERTPAGPFIHSPNGFGFDYFYGFNGASTSQFTPALMLNNAPVEPPNEPDYILDRDLADHAVAWLRMQTTQTPDRPFLLYYAPSSTHSPVQAPKEWIDRFRGKFDEGWDRLRQETYERQIKLGIIPPDAKLTPMSPGTPVWASLTDDQRRLYARYMEAYAAALAYSDAQIGRIIEELKREGRFDNTLIFFIEGDNGATAEGGADGAFNVMDRANQISEDLQTNLRRIDEVGGPESNFAIPVGWSRAMNTPFQWNKWIASHFGGTGNGLVVSWPGHTTQPARIRSQFDHLIDIAPTIYQAAGIAYPATVDGAPQQPLDGFSMLESFTNPDAPTRRRVQYFETFGNMGLYEDGWFLSSRPSTATQSIYNFGHAQTTWELYDLHNDYSQAVDLAAQQPARVASMAARFQAEAERYHVNPITSDIAGRIVGDPRPDVVPQPGHYVFYDDGQRYSEYAFPDTRNRSWTLEAKLEAPGDGGVGTIVAQGDRFAGWGLFVIGGKPTFIYRLNETDAGLTTVIAPSALAPGAHRLGVKFAYDGGGLGKGAKATLIVDGHPVGVGRIGQSVGLMWAGEGATVGWDTGKPLIDGYQTPFRYSGRVDQVVIDTTGAHIDDDYNPD
jgi:arylsulfatase